MDVIATDICIKNKRIARLTVLLENNEDTTVSFVNDVAKVLAIMLRNQRNQENNSPLSELIKYLVDNDQVDIAKISNYLELSKVKLHKQYYVGIVESKAFHRVSRLLSGSSGKKPPERPLSESSSKWSLAA